MRNCRFTLSKSLGNSSKNAIKKLVKNHKKNLRMLVREMSVKSPGCPPVEVACGGEGVPPAADGAACERSAARIRPPGPDPVTV